MSHLFWHRGLGELKECKTQECRDSVQAKYDAISKPRDEEFKRLETLCDGGKGNFTGFLEIHYDLREKFTKEGNAYYLEHKDDVDSKDGGFIKLTAKQTKFHTFVTDPKTGKVTGVLTQEMKGYTKLVHPVFGYEIVLDANDNVVTNAVNAGTYNFYNPNIKGVKPNPLLGGGDVLGIFGNHKDFDVDPYFDHGNAPNPVDPTTENQRLLRSLYSPKIN